jgi:predicted PurR-regulated permease PerM
VYLTKDFLATILASVVLVFLLKPVYAIIYRITNRGQISSLFSILIVFIFILAFLMSLTTVLLVEISNLQRSGAISNIQFSTITQEINLLAQEKLPLWLYNYVD